MKISMRATTNNNSAHLVTLEDYSVKITIVCTDLMLLNRPIYVKTFPSSKRLRSRWLFVASHFFFFFADRKVITLTMQEGVTDKERRLAATVAPLPADVLAIPFVKAPMALPPPPTVPRPYQDDLGRPKVNT